MSSCPKLSRALAVCVLTATVLVPVGSAHAGSHKHPRHDIDRDGRPNGRDRDIDGDGRPNGRDRDIDGDRRPNGRDRDIDGDRRPNGRDRDIDGDRRPNGRDRDIDGDGRPNRRDRDIDADRVPNRVDRDIDADGRANLSDRDMDGDGTPNHSDYDTDSSGNDRGPAGAVPPGFFGLIAEETFPAQGAEREQMLAQIASTGAGRIRLVFHWSHMEHQPGNYDFGPYDLYVAAAARHGLDLLPVLSDPPAFYSSAPQGAPVYLSYPPQSNAPFRAFARAIVARYGNSGSFWREHPEVPRRPIRAWQVWNEPNTASYWPSGPNPAAYAEMLREVSAGIKEADPQAEVVSAALTFSERGMPIQEFVRGMYAAGAASAFDTFAVNSYAVGPDLVTDQVAAVRRLMSVHGDGWKPIRVTETGWATSGGRHFLRVGPAAQAALVRSTLDRFARLRERLGITSVDLFSWKNQPPYGSQPDYWGLHAGLVASDGSPKPALTAFVQTVHRLASR